MDHSHPVPEGSRAGPLPELPEPVAVPEKVAEAAEAASRGGGLAALFRIDVAPLRRSRDFRLLFIGQAVSFFGSMVTYVALPYQAYRISHSSLIVGLLSLAELVPLVITAFVGGALADVVDRRRMVRLTETAMCFVTGALVVNSLSAHPRLWVLFAVAFAAAGIDGLQRPSLDAMVPRLVPAEELPAAAALSSLKGTLGMVAGPPVAGVLWTRPCWLVMSIGRAASPGSSLRTRSRPIGSGSSSVSWPSRRRSPESSPPRWPRRWERG